MVPVASVEEVVRTVEVLVEGGHPLEVGHRSNRVVGPTWVEVLVEVDQAPENIKVKCLIW